MAQASILVRISPEIRSSEVFAPCIPPGWPAGEPPPLLPVRQINNILSYLTLHCLATLTIQHDHEPARSRPHPPATSPPTPAPRPRTFPECRPRPHPGDGPRPSCLILAQAHSNPPVAAEPPPLRGSADPLLCSRGAGKSAHHQRPALHTALFTPKARGPVSFPGPDASHGNCSATSRRAPRHRLGRSGW